MRDNDWVSDLVRDLWALVEEADLPHLHAAALTRGLGSPDPDAESAIPSTTRTGLGRPMLRLVQANKTTSPCH
jgi:hypothetical protein